ncbi:MAG: RNA polymerase sigma factor [Oscillospiraceae bacterium]|nr:RNA polymerase sigma factor [Oscillospiraceae bacterium]
MEDDEIVELFLARDESALAKTAEKYGKRLRALALHICGDLSAAEECENDTYLKAWNSIPPHEPRNYLFSFLAKITRCTALDRVKKEARERTSELTEELENTLPSPNDVEKRLDGKLLSEAISAFLRTQSAEKRNIFLRRYWFTDSVSEIARRFSISEGKVKSVLFRTRNALQEYLKKEGFL